MSDARRQLPVIAAAVGLAVLITTLVAGSHGRTYAALSDSATLRGNTATAGVFAPDPPARCGSLSKYDEIVYGTAGPDLISGTSGASSVVHLNHNGTSNADEKPGDGNQIIMGMGGRDVITGGNGKDCLVGGDGDDTIHGDNGKDTLLGGDGNDTIYGGNAPDLIDGGSGRNVCFGGHAPNIINCTLIPLSTTPIHPERAGQSAAAPSSSPKGTSEPGPGTAPTTAAATTTAPGPPAPTTVKPGPPTTTDMPTRVSATDATPTDSSSPAGPTPSSDGPTS